MHSAKSKIHRQAAREADPQRFVVPADQAFPHVEGRHPVEGPRCRCRHGEADAAKTFQVGHNGKCVVGVEDEQQKGVGVHCRAPENRYEAGLSMG